MLSQKAFQATPVTDPVSLRCLRDLYVDLSRADPQNVQALRHLQTVMATSMLDVGFEKFFFSTPGAYVRAFEMLKLPLENFTEQFKRLLGSFWPEHEPQAENFAYVLMTLLKASYGFELAEAIDDVRGSVQMSLDFYCNEHDHSALTSSHILPIASLAQQALEEAFQGKIHTPGVLLHPSLEHASNWTPDERMSLSDYRTLFPDSPLGPNATWVSEAFLYTLLPSRARFFAPADSKPSARTIEAAWRLFDDANKGEVFWFARVALDSAALL